YALSNLLGPVAFVGVGWASILAIAFCAIDFAGLVRLFTPDSGVDQPKEVWYLMGAWLLGATMNALMTWWAVSLTLLNHDFGNEVLTRAQLLQIVPIFVATLVWLTRILFIGALTVTGSHLLFSADDEPESRGAKSLSNAFGSPMTEWAASASRSGNVPGRAWEPRQELPHVSDELPAFLNRRASQEESEEVDEGATTIVHSRPERSTSSLRDAAPAKPTVKRDNRTLANGRVRQRPPMPGSNGYHASSRGGD
ncbi:MAG TPA: hypothetical protein VE553_01870, partial [Candidatus Binatia bacterium]|nr:hypothetical protein [Candidatus Binatia bacterium]